MEAIPSQTRVLTRKLKHQSGESSSRPEAYDKYCIFFLLRASSRFPGPLKQKGKATLKGRVRDTGHKGRQVPSHRLVMFVTILDAFTNCSQGTCSGHLQVANPAKGRSVY